MLREQDFFNRLLLLPLFQGIGRGEFVEIAQSIRIGFQRVCHKYVIVRQDELCTRLYFVLHGSVCISRESDDHSFTLTEWQDLPMVVQPEVLFGLSTRYTRTYTVAHSAEIIAVDKAAVRDFLFDYPTFRINYLNLVSTQVQMANRQLWHSPSSSAARRFVQFIAARSLRPAGKKELCIQRADLATALQCGGHGIAQMLHTLQDSGLIVLGRGHIMIPTFEKLLAAVR